MTTAGLQSDFSRRTLGRRALTLLGAGAALSFYNEAALAQLSMIGPMPPDAVKINANENPLGAAKAIFARSKSVVAIIPITGGKTNNKVSMLSKSGSLSSWRSRL